MEQPKKDKKKVNLGINKNKYLNEKVKDNTSSKKIKIDDVITKTKTGTVNSKGESVYKTSDGTYKKTNTFTPNKATLHQGVKNSNTKIDKDLNEKSTSTSLGLRAPLHYLANPDHILGDVGNVTGFKPLKNTFGNSDDDAERYNRQALDPSKTSGQRRNKNFNEAVDLLPGAITNLTLGTLASKTPLGAIKEAYNPIPLPFSSGIKYDPTDYWKSVNNQQDTADLLTSNGNVENFSYDWLKKHKPIEQNINKFAQGGKLGDPPINGDQKFIENWYKNRKTIQGKNGETVNLPDFSNLDFNPKIKEFDSKRGPLGYFRPKSAQININQSNPDNVPGIQNHETNHYLQEQMGSENFNKYIKDPFINNINKKNAQDSFKLNYNGTKRYSDYLLRPDETHSRLMQFRQSNSYKPDEIIDQERLKNSKDRDTLMLDMFDDNEMLNLLNKTVDNTKLPNVNMAAYGGLINKTNNDNMLNEFNEGGTHEQNPMGGIPMGQGDNGQMNTVEEGETMKEDFVYSDRVVLTPETIAEFNLPKSLSNKTAAEATKIINRKFEDRTDKITMSTKNGLLDKIAQAQENLKQIEAQQIAQAQQMNSQEVPDMMGGEVPQGMEEFMQPGQNQMFGGGNLNGVTDTLGMMGRSGMMGQHTGINQLTTGLELGNMAFGKSGIDTSGAVDVNPGEVKPGMMGVQSAMKGAQAGMMFGPLGAGIGGAIGLGAGLIGGFKAKKDALKAHQNFEIGQSNKMISDFAFGGLLGEPITGEPKLPVTKTPSTTVVSKKELKNLTIQPPTDNEKPSTSKLKGAIVELQNGSNKDGIPGQWVYYKQRSTPGFNPETDRDFVYNKNSKTLTDTYEYHTFMNERRKAVEKNRATLNTNIQLTQPLSLNNTTAFKMGGNMYRGGGQLDQFGTPIKPWNQPSSKMTDDPSYQARGPEGFFKPTNTAPQVGAPQPQSKARTFGPQSNGHYEGEMYDGSKLGKVASKVGKYAKDNYGNALRYSSVAMNAYQLHQLNKEGYDTVDPILNNTRYNPEYMDEKALTNQINAESNYAGSALANSANGSLGTLRNNILFSERNKNRALSDAYRTVGEANGGQTAAAQQFNLGVDEANIARRVSAEDKTAMNKGAFKTEQSKLRGQIGTDLGEIGKEEVYKKIAKNATGYTYDGTYVKDTSGKTVNDPATGKPMTKEKLDELQNGSSKKNYSQVFKNMQLKYKPRE